MGKHEDSCSCHKTSEGWGRGGFHFREFSNLDIQLHLEKRLGHLSPGTDREKAAVEIRKELELYIGRDVAYERCPAYSAATEKSIAENRAKRRAETVRHKGTFAGGDF